jgi:hypothetical protein
MEKTISGIINATLSADQTLQSVVVTKIGGTAVRNRRSLAATAIDFVITLEENCGVNCDPNTTAVAHQLYEEVKTDLSTSVSSGVFLAALLANDNDTENGGSSVLAGGVTVAPPTYAAFVLITQSPTKFPTKSPVTNSPTTKSPTKKPVAPGATLWYPDWVSADRTCKNDGNAPDYMTTNIAAWMFKDRDACCKFLLYNSLSRFTSTDRMFLHLQQASSISTTICKIALELPM